jgi:phosphate transport system substrate-binding protein
MQMTRRRSTAWAALPIVAVALGSIAAPRASAQATAPRPPAAEAGKQAVPPSASLWGRKALYIVGSSTLKPVTDLIVGKMIAEYSMPQPIEDFKGSLAGFKQFCAGAGPLYPDIVAASRRMEQGEYEDCLANHVLDIIQVEIGQGAVVVVTKKGNPVFNVTPRMFYFALADKIPVGDEFKYNTNKSWKATKKSAPDLPIHVVLPAKGSGTRAFFDDFFMQTGCRHLKAIDAIFAADERVPLCITLREDGHVTEDPEPFEKKMLADLQNSPPGTLAIMPRSLYLANRDRLSVLPVDGVLPMHKNIDNYDYEMTTTLVYYFKRANILQNDGAGVVRGIPEFMAEITEPAMVGEGGKIEKLGVTALSPSQQRHEQSVARRLVRYRP